MHFGHFLPICAKASTDWIKLLLYIKYDCFFVLSSRSPPPITNLPLLNLAFIPEHFRPGEPPLEVRDQLPHGKRSPGPDARHAREARESDQLPDLSHRHN